jgi:hypothetical protein
MAEYRIEFRDWSKPARTVQAAGVAASASFPDMLVFHDGSGTEVLMVGRDQVLTIDRADTAEQPPATAAGFKPTTQLMGVQGQPPQ